MRQAAEGPRPHVFISSVVDGFEEYRKAAADGVVAGGAVPIMVETYPSLARSPRSACLDGVQSSDSLVIIVGERGGWTTPAGLLAVEEEYAEARKHSLPILVFLQDGVKRDAAATAFAKTLSDYVAGVFRTTFESPADLCDKVASAVRGLAKDMKIPTADPGRIHTHLVEATDGPSYEASLRLAVVPERAEEIIPPQTLDSGQLRNQIYAMGHDSRVAFFDYACGKTMEVSQDGVLRVTQQSERGRAHQRATLALSQRGEVVLEADIAGKDDKRDSTHAGFVILEDDLVATVTAEFAMAAAILDHLDPHERLGSVWMGAAVLNAEHRHLLKGRPQGQSMAIRMGDGQPVLAEKSPRKLSRAQLRAASPEIERLLALFRRLLGEKAR